MNILLKKIAAIARSCNVNKKLGAHPKIVTFNLDRFEAALADDPYLKNLGDEQQPALEELAKNAEAERLQREHEARKKAAQLKAENDARILAERKAHEKKLQEAETIRLAEKQKRIADAKDAEAKAALLGNAAKEIAKSQNGTTKSK